MVADYATTGLTLGAHPLALLRGRLPAGTVTCRDLDALPHGTPVRIGGLVVARQRPGTAKGIVFLLLEDEFGTINVIVPPDVYERARLTVRAEPLVLAEGRLERLAAGGGAINILVRDVRPLVTPDDDAAAVVELAARRAAATAAELDTGVAVGAAAVAGTSAEDTAEVTLADFRGVAPAVQSFASGRRR
jgi:error-prone DNA polymerase